MQILAILFAFIAIGVAIPFAGGRLTPSRIVAYDSQADINTAQLQIYARAAWTVGRTMGAGSISRASLPLPPGYSDNATYPNQAWSDGTYIYVWSGNPDPTAMRLTTFQGFDRATSVGTSSFGSITYTDGSSAYRPLPIPYPCLVVRMHV